MVVISSRLLGSRSSVIGNAAHILFLANLRASYLSALGSAIRVRVLLFLLTYLAILMLVKLLALSAQLDLVRALCLGLFLALRVRRMVLSWFVEVAIVRLFMAVVGY